EPEPVPMDLFRRVAGYSWVVHTVMRKLLPRYWFEGRDRREIVHHDGLAVAKELLRRFARELGERGIRLAVGVGAGCRLLEDDQREGAEVLTSLTGTDVRCLDLHPELVALRARDRAAFQAMYRGHMTPPGNRWVAEHIAALLQR